jgi:hypothetical protein
MKIYRCRKNNGIEILTNHGIEFVNTILQLDDMVIKNEKIKLETGENFDDIEFTTKAILYSIRKSYGIEENSKLYNDMEDTFRTYTGICSLNAALGVIFLMVDNEFKKATKKYYDDLEKDEAAVILFDRVFDIRDFIFRASVTYRWESNTKN